MVAHLPFRAWCRHCVKGKAKGLPHRLKDKVEKANEQVPLVSIDYIGIEGDESVTAYMKEANDDYYRERMTRKGDKGKED